MHAFTGTWRLFRLALRRDRIKLPIILLVLAFVFWGSVGSTLDFYGKSEQDRIQYAATNAPSVVGRVFNGPVGGPDIGAIVMNETFITTAIAIAFVSSMAVVRHTRQNEEFGRSDLIESGIVARHASLAAAMLVVVLANIGFSMVMYLALVASDMPVDGSLAASAAMAGVGLVFAGFGAVAAQLADSARGANSYAALAIGTTFLLRGIGDGGGSLTADGLSVKSGFLSWLSPFGWAQQVFPYTLQRWWIFGLLGGLFILLIGISVAFMARRDIGMGMISTRPGRARALPRLLSSFGLARRLQSGILRGWAIAIVVFGVSFGLVVKEFENFLADNEQIQESFQQMGFSGTSYRDVFLSILISMMSIMIAGYSVQALLRMRSEESNGQLESVLATSVGRIKWMLSHIGIIYTGVILLLLLLGLSMGASFIISTNSSASEIWRILGASMIQAVPIFAFAGFVILVFSLLPNLSVPIAWGGFALTLLIVQVGALLKLPQILMDISPFVHLPAMPASDFKLVPVLWLGLVAGIMLGLGLIRFRQRDLSTE